ncbi:adhesion G protein-coupled receptor B3-like isoform X2 [Mercenaria mercenaria]|uniref:adhesion G protein-coupled receptor B3-like isoform X2 n=1 Tax=Mercenaria mercenaria TaxID=6596 RepID=UPI00234F31F4|nr:adhesion G protein-coupled receptor B3-like isoform X2 [Mercenaria mercenaria]
MMLFSFKASLECYNCSGVTNLRKCNTKVTCEDKQVCFKKREYTEHVSYDLGCVDNQNCGDFANFTSGSGVSAMKMDGGQTQPCFECCSTNNCNFRLCGYKDSSECVDDAKTDCAYLNSLFSICKLINQAKKLCPKYCKLCNVVDGNWSPWSNWSDCDVTCENGTQIRTRSCTDPAPQYGGLDCPGNDTDTKSCHREPCPVHGGWSTWSLWSLCSESCDIGIRHRDRSCTEPYPSLFGDHCFGNSREYKKCMPGACADGGWSMWKNWGSCTESCGGGVRTRSRSCTNPRPSLTGRSCEGDNTDVSTCNRTACPEYNVAFTAYNVHRNSSSYATLLFQKTYTNFGNAYDTTTGKFTCNIPGVYHFVVTLLKCFQDINKVFADLKINGSNKLQLFLRPKNNNYNEAYMLTGAGTFHLNRNDVVHVHGVPNYFYNSYNSYFTGFLITPDE